MLQGVAMVFVLEVEPTVAHYERLPAIPLH